MIRNAFRHSETTASTTVRHPVQQLDRGTYLGCVINSSITPVSQSITHVCTFLVLLLSPGQTFSFFGWIRERSRPDYRQLFWPTSVVVVTVHSSFTRNIVCVVIWVIGKWYSVNMDAVHWVLLNEYLEWGDGQCGVTKLGGAMVGHVLWEERWLVMWCGRSDGWSCAVGGGRSNDWSCDVGGAMVSHVMWEERWLVMWYW